MKHRLAMALSHISLTIDPDTKRLREVPDKFYDAAKRISYRDYLTTYIALIRNPKISAEWVIRGNGKMIVDDHTSQDLVKTLTSENAELRKQLQRETGRNNMLINRLGKLTKTNNKRGPGAGRQK